MLIKLLVPSHTHLLYPEPGGGTTGASLAQNRSVDSDKTRAAMQATYDVAEDFDKIFENRPDVAVLHDLRFNSADGNLHIDHLFVTHDLHVFIVESRTTAGTLSIDDKKKFTIADQNGATYAIPSPIRQLRQNRSMFKRVMHNLDLPKRFGRQLAPTFHNYLLIDPHTILLNRSDIKADYFVTPSHLVALIDQQAQSRSLLGFLRRMPTTQLRLTSRKIARMHIPKTVRFSSKFRHIKIVANEQK